MTFDQKVNKFWENNSNSKHWYSLHFKMSVALTHCTQIKEWNKIIIIYNIFTKLPLLYKKKTNLKLHWKLCERKVGRKKLKLYWKCKVIFILKQIFLAKATLILKRRE